MSDEFKTFPNTYLEALALMYVQSQNLSDSDPENLVHMYWEAYFRMKKENLTAKTDERAKWNP